MSSPWEIEQERPRVYFGQVEVNIEERTASNGNQYWKLDFTVGPLDSSNLIQRSYFSFGRDWNKITLPSLKAILDNPQEISGKWAKFRWETWRDYSKNTVEYYQDNDVDKLQSDEKGKLFVEKYAMFFEAVFTSENECETAFNEHYSIDASNVQKQEQDQMMPFIFDYVKNALNGSGKVDREKLAELIASSPLAANYTVDSPSVKMAIEEIEMDHIPF